MVGKVTKFGISYVYRLGVITKKSLDRPLDRIPPPPPSPIYLGLMRFQSSEFVDISVLSQLTAVHFCTNTSNINNILVVHMYIRQYS